MGIKEYILAAAVALLVALFSYGEHALAAKAKKIEPMLIARQSVIAGLACLIATAGLEAASPDWLAKTTSPGAYLDVPGF